MKRAAKKRLKSAIQMWLFLTIGLVLTALLCLGVSVLQQHYGKALAACISLLIAPVVIAAGYFICSEGSVK